MLLTSDQEVVLGDPFADQTNLHPLGIAAVGVLGLLTLVVPRRYAILPILTLACFIPSGQRIVLYTLDFTFLRVMVVFAWLRIALRREFSGFRWHAVDMAILACTAVSAIAYSALWMTGGAVIHVLGESFDALGMYFMFRCTIRDVVAMDRIARTATVISILVAIAFLVEKSTGRNPFSIFGGVPEITAMREGRLRCQGAFSHPILAGCFWGALLPLIVARWWTMPRDRWLVVVGVTSTLTILYACASSTPILMLSFACAGACAYPLRRHMRSIRWAALFGLLLLHFSMKAPVWHLVSRIDVVGGSTGWQRYHLIDQAIARFGEWWLLGTRSTYHWGIQLFDLTNQYVLQGVRGGIASVVLFIAAIAFAFRSVGRSWRRGKASKGIAVIIWALGVSIFSQSMAFFAVSYFGQIQLIWYLVLAAAASIDFWRPAPRSGGGRDHRLRRRKDESNAAVVPAT